MSTAIESTLNETAYGFALNRFLKLLNKLTSAIDQFQTRIAVRDAIAFAQMLNKYHYDRRHQLMFLRVEDWALLRLHRGYKISSTTGITTKLA